MTDYSKWDNYSIGNIHYVKEHRDNIARIAFIDYILKNDIDNILEIGPGELIEAQEILKQKKVKYSVLDVSKTFLKHCESLNIVECFEGEMHKTTFLDKQFNLVYMSSVIEHTPDLNKTISELSRISKTYYITMFKWFMKSGDLDITYSESKKFYSSTFNIFKLLDLLQKSSIIHKKIIGMKQENIMIDFDDYVKNMDNSIDLHRNGNHLSVIGEWK
ncbi:MAG: methyltransferase domain-containing protein [Nanoarchaeota archaeon]